MILSDSVIYLHPYLSISREFRFKKPLQPKPVRSEWQTSVHGFTFVQSNNSGSEIKQGATRSILLPIEVGILPGFTFVARKRIYRNSIREETWTKWLNRYRSVATAFKPDRLFIAREETKRQTRRFRNLQRVLPNPSFFYLLHPSSKYFRCSVTLCY